MSANAYGFDRPSRNETVATLDHEAPADPPGGPPADPPGAPPAHPPGAPPATSAVPARGSPLDIPPPVPVDDRAAGRAGGLGGSFVDARAPDGSGTVARRMPGGARAFAMSALFGAAVAMVAMFLLSTPLGFRSLTVMSGSMEPTLGVGDVVMERAIAPLDVRVGDVVTFRDPTDQSTLITHRVRSYRVHDGTVDFVTKGDANNTVERWSIPVGGRLGLVVVHVPKVGYALVWASGRTGRIALIAIPGVLLGAIELRRIWRPRSRA